MSGLSRCPNTEPSIYFGKGVLIFVYVDDIWMTGTVQTRIEMWKSLKAVLRTKEVTSIKHFLGLAVETDEANFWIHQTRVVNRLIESFIQEKVEKGDTSELHRYQTPSLKEFPSRQCVSFADSCRTHIGSLMYVTGATRPDISYAVTKLSREVTRWSSTSEHPLYRIYSY
eukprot:GHVN01016465.1.p1 GENE.GHVN01016465.1~~GHVN01016465.1.p1  ORF type:complete len:170 (-),score=9.42 GHVN01016465.1:531-1040(-)